jgi:hypothetical protein
MAHIETCPSCGSREFTVQEIYYHAGAINERGALVYKSDGDGGRERIQCANGDRDFDDDAFVAVDFV